MTVFGFSETVSEGTQYRMPLLKINNAEKTLMIALAMSGKHIQLAAYSAHSRTTLLAPL